ncbi:MAG: hypothetical protein HFACDABA_01297 [Anaerolineales bacterium]|nr:hypothetical protein [Anaerolineales bacterium]
MKYGRLLILLLCAIGLAGTLITGAALYSRLLYLGALITLTSLTLTRLGILGLRVERRVRLSRVSVGDVFEERYEVINDGRFTTLWAEVINGTDLPGAAGSRLLTRVGGRQTRSYRARTWITRRGRFSLGPTTLVTGDPFGLFRAQRIFPAEASLVALPSIFPIHSFPYLPGLLHGGRVISRKAIDITSHASSVREYATGDPLKRIHWPTTARRGELMVKEFDRDPQTEIWLFLDLQSNVHYEKKYNEIARGNPDQWMLGRRPAFRLPPSTLEYSISIAASLAHYFLAQKRAVGFACAGGRAYTLLPAERGERQEAKILETLAYLEGDGYTSIAALASMQAAHLSSGSGVALITPSVRKELLVAVDELVRRHLRPAVILLMAESFGGNLPGSDSLVRALTERGVPLLPVYCDSDLAQTFSDFSKRAPTQETSSWQSQFTPSI